MNIIILKQIGDALGISKQAVAKTASRYLQKNEKNKIDLDNPVNREYLRAKGVNLANFGVKTSKIKQKASETESKPRKKEQSPPEIETNTEYGALMKLDMQLKLESIKAKRATTQLSNLKLEESSGKLIRRDIAEKLINETVGSIIQSFITLPSSVVDIVISTYESNPDNRREKIVQLLQDRYTKEAKKIVETAQRKYAKEIEEQMKRSENEQPRS